MRSEMAPGTRWLDAAASVVILYATLSVVGKPIWEQDSTAVSSPRRDVRFAKTARVLSDMDGGTLTHVGSRIATGGIQPKPLVPDLDDFAMREPHASTTTR